MSNPIQKGLRNMNKIWQHRTETNNHVSSFINAKSITPNMWLNRTDWRQQQQPRHVNYVVSCFISLAWLDKYSNVTWNVEVTWCSLRPRQTVEPHNGVHQEPQTRPRHGGKQTGQVSSEEINLPWWPQLLSNKSCPRCIYGLEVSKTGEKVKHKTNKYLYVIGKV